MTTQTKATLTLREQMLGLLTDDETSKVSKAETAVKLNEGDEYLDLDAPSRGVLKSGASAVELGRALPKKAVQQRTWDALVAMSVAAKVKTH